MKKDNVPKILTYGDDLYDTIFKAFVETISSNSNSPKQEKPIVGKLMWKQKEVLSHDTRVSPQGNLVTEIVYKIPVVFEKENPGPIKIGKIITALESMLDQKYSNFINIEKCSINIDDKYYIKSAAVFLDHGPSQREK